MSLPLVLAIEPDLRQAAIVKRIVREQALAEVAVVDSRDAAIETMRTCMPDVLLLSALLSPRDEDELMAHLRTLDNAGHLQTHTIPQLASSLGPGEERGSRGLLSAFRRKKADTAPVAGCDPDMFADEIRVYLQRAADRKRLLQTQSFVAPDMRPSATAATAAAAAEHHEEPAAAAESSSWASPFEWKPSTSRKTRAKTEAPPAPAPAPPPAAAPAPPAFAMEPAEAEAVVAPQPAEPVTVTPPLVVAPAAVEPLVAPLAAAAPEPISVSPRVAETPPPVPVLHTVAHSDTVTAPDPPVVIAKAKPADPPRPKAVAERGPKLTGRMQIQDLLKVHFAKEDAGRDRLGPLARWARTDAPRTAKAAAVTSEDVRALISSLAVPPAVASVTYPRGCRIRRVRVPISPEQPAA